MSSKPVKAVHIHAAIATAARKAKVANAPKYPAGIITLQVLGSGAKGAPASLYVFTDQVRYLFNCGEGTQRLAHEHKMKLGKLEHVFMTRRNWETVGGLPGLALTVQDIGVPNITLHGPPSIERIFWATNRFIIMKNLNITAANCLDNKYVEDHVMRVEYVPLYPQKRTKEGESDRNSSSSGSSSDGCIIPEEDDIDYHPPLDGSKRHLENTIEENQKKPKLSSDTSKQTSEGAGSSFDSDTPKDEIVMCYICRPKKKEGVLLIDRCKALGVPFGPLLGKLKSGHDITLPNGKTILASEVRSPDSPGPVFAVVDCPSEAYIEALVNNKVWHQQHTSKTTDSNNEESNSPSVVVHFTPQKVLLDSRYVNWMEQFGEATQHLILNDTCRGFGSEAVHRLQYKLNIVDDQIFPILQPERERPSELESLSSANSNEDISISNNNNNRNSDQVNLTSTVPRMELPLELKTIKAPVILGETLLNYCIRPHKGIDTSTVVSICPEDYKQDALGTEGFTENLQALKSKFLQMDATIEHKEFPNILFLGTGSCIPNKARNVSSISIQTNKDTRIILDCGEGTYGQLHRIYGPSKIDKVLIEIKAIYVSHLHADHHLGLIALLKERKLAFANLKQPFVPVIVIAPQQIQYWLTFYHKVFEKIKSLYKLVPNLSLLSVTNCDNNDDLDDNNAVSNEELFKLLEMKTIQTTLVTHCPHAFGIALIHETGWKLAYSGDTMPCDSFVRLGQGSDVCIHEATMEDDLVHEARIKMHSTTSEAIEIGNKMNAKFTLLTHFSQRYAKVPKIDSGLAPHVGIAFDNMNVRLTDLYKIPLMYDTLKVLFAEDYEVMTINTTKKLRKRELELELEQTSDKVSDQKQEEQQQQQQQS